MKKLLVFFSIVLLHFSAQSQELNFTVAASNQFSPSISYQKMYELGSKKKFSIGWGVRLNSFFGGEKSYLTAPASLTTGKQSIAALFSELIPGNIDTLNVQRSSLVALNTMIALQYRFKRSAIGFNIDAIGFTLGGKQNALFNAAESAILDQTRQMASPTPFNLLLIGDSDRGSINSELFFSHLLKSQNAIRFGVSFQFLEYTTENALTFDNARFRYKTLMPFVSYTVNLKK